MRNIKNTTIENITSKGWGGAIYNDGSLISSNSISNSAPTDGMIIFNNTVKGANLVLHNGTLAFHNWCWFPIRFELYI